MLEKSERDAVESWALQRAHNIVLREGVSLINAAQWLDKKKIADNSARLRQAIAHSLIEALEERYRDRFGRGAETKTQADE